MELFISSESSSADKEYVRNNMIAFNVRHFPAELNGRYQEINLFLKNANGQTVGGIVGEICWNWLEVHFLFIEEQYRHSGYGTKLLNEVEQIAKAKKCDFIKLDTLSFQALDFYKKHGFEIFGTIHNAGTHAHYYLKKDLTY